MKNYIYISLLLATTFLWGCRHEPPVQPDATTEVNNYPEHIKAILTDKCATAGCHNDKSYKAAGGLRLDTWEHLLKGGNNGAVVVPYNSDNSSLLYFVNTNPALGTTAEPTMPYNAAPLSEEEYLTLQSWIDSGAIGKDGRVPFAENKTTRQKIYAVQQGCDLIAVIDAEQQVVMRYITVGINYGTENPNNIIISPDGKYAYVSFWNAKIIQKIDITADSVLATVHMPENFQKSISLSSDGSKLIACNWYRHDLLMVDANSMTIEKNLGTKLRFISGFTGNPNGGFYGVCQFGNTVYKIAADGSYETVSIDSQPAVQETGATTPDPYELCLSPDNSRYFITCTNTSEVRVMDATTDMPIKAIKVGENPQKMAVSTTMPYLFVTCMNDTLAPLEVGSVYVIDYEQLTVVKKITGKFFQPYGIAADDREGIVYIFSRNEDKNGPPPHHSSPCDGRNGFYQVFDINTLEPYTNKRFEVTVDPYSAATRF